MTSTSTAPININLTGDFVIPVEGTPPVAGSVSGDLRLAVLDAFLQSLDNPLKANSAGASALAKGFKRLARGCDKDFLEKNDVVLAVTTVVEPTTHSITHTFRFTVAPKV